MNLKLIALGTTGVATITGVSLGVWYLTSSDNSSVPSGKTLKTRYPKSAVREYQTGASGKMVDNGFWKEKAQKLNKDYFPNKAIWGPLYESIKSNNIAGKYNFQESSFRLEEPSKTFLGGDAEIAQILAKYCIYKWDKEEPSIKDYADILKDLCT